MKIFKMAMICVSILTLSSTMVLADASVATTTGGTTLTIAANTTTGTDAFNFTPSPSTLLAIETTPLAFALTSASTKTTTDNGVMYGVLSSASPVYELAQAADGALTAPTSATSLGSDWKDKSGNTAP
ncbi:hypothetical protein [Desulfobacula sp.]|uniref:hypothetical protein n=1 Tax=Desulfobacula sp. TaxID=2593537 RepID=UPI00260D3950|nr:hypothetical protein [Desulfobacula sp.]